MAGSTNRAHPVPSGQNHEELGEREHFESIVAGLLTDGARDSQILGRGKVFLVGAGPGDPELITLKGKRCLEVADVVVFDSLVDRRLLTLCRPGAEQIYVGKRDGVHSRPQEEINEILIRESMAGRTVTRLKGGDPFIFGRGGEEALALAQAGIAVEVIPGVSAGIGVPAYSGIPLTHRDISAQVTFVTGHECTKSGGSSVQWDLLARSRGTLVVFMGLRNLPHIVSMLVAHGRQPDTPVAVIQSGTTDHQMTVEGTLADILQRVRDAGLEPPALVIVGEVVRLGKVLRWFVELERARR